MSKVYTITYGDVAENHARMQKIGTLHEKGYSIEHLEKVQEKLNGYGLTTELFDLNAGFDPSYEKAKVLVIRKGVQYILQEDDTEKLMKENDNLTMDKKAFMRGRVVNKLARWNLCFSDEDQEPDYENAKGRIVAWKHIPKMSQIRQVISEWTEDVMLNAEANYYYDIKKCGIGYHGDAERRKVVAVRMGASMPIYYKWYQHSEAIGEPIKIDLHDGDMYIMSEKAVGFDWLKKKTATLRHATGCTKYVQKN
uniref:2OGFeDO JBP1/TET oxygenase domain-containing protein n=1 Tax=viral metagenome TaxID=1070528 RepID=A0A6C0IWJ9_9ZZZZ